MADTAKVHPATLVTNIKACVPVTLDYDGTQYNNWTTVFKLHCRLVIDHIIPPTASDSSSKSSFFFNGWRLFGSALMILYASGFTEQSPTISLTRSSMLMTLLWTHGTGWLTSSRIRASQSLARTVQWLIALV